MATMGRRVKGLGGFGGWGMGVFFFPVCQDCEVFPNVSSMALFCRCLYEPPRILSRFPIQNAMQDAHHLDYAYAEIALLGHGLAGALLQLEFGAGLNSDL